MLNTIFYTNIVESQNCIIPYENKAYPFINDKENKLLISKESGSFENIFSKLDTLLYNGIGQLNIVHIGASHIQADQLSGRIRECLFNLMPGLVSSRGILFPYSMANSNHPFNYYTTFKGNWEACRNVEKNKVCNMGVMGISAKTTDSISELNVFFKRQMYPEFMFNKITVLHATGDSCFEIELMLDDTTECFKESYEGHTVFFTKRFIDTLNFNIFKTDSLQNIFELYGIIAGVEGFNGITYHSIGVNGASVSSYLRCQLFREQLKLLEPDIVILSLGINDVQNKDFKADDYEFNYERLLYEIRGANPESAIIFTTNSDSYYKKKYPNKFSLDANEVVYKLSEKYNNIAIWDWFEIMGGLGSVKKWERHNLAKKDLVHFTREGYYVLGELFFSAFMKSFEDFLKNNELNDE